MQFIVIAHDYQDSLERRLKVRAQHVAMGDKMVVDEKALYGVTLLNDNGEMAGSVYVVDFQSRRELDEWLESEPYVVKKVWEKIEVIPCIVGPSFKK